MTAIRAAIVHSGIYRINSVPHLINDQGNGGRVVDEVADDSVKLLVKVRQGWRNITWEEPDHTRKVLRQRCQHTFNRGGMVDVPWGTTWGSLQRRLPDLQPNASVLRIVPHLVDVLIP